MLKFLPEKVLNLISDYSKFQLLEVRIRADKKVKITLNYSGEVKTVPLNVSLSFEEIEKCVLRLSNFSVFSAEEMLKEGYITSSDGERVGICGEVVKTNGGYIVKRPTSLCVRFPSDIIGASDEFFDKYIGSDAKSCLVISPPFQGKTTFIRDLGRKYSDKLIKNVLFLDERNEFSAGGRFDLGENSDILRFTTKEFGFKSGVRSLNPEVIVCDELIEKTDYTAVNFAIASGVKILASVHSDDLENLLKKPDLSEIIKSFTFDYYVVLDTFKVKTVYDNEFKKLC